MTPELFSVSHKWLVAAPFCIAAGASLFTCLSSFIVARHVREKYVYPRDTQLPVQFHFENIANLCQWVGDLQLCIANAISIPLGFLGLGIRSVWCVIASIIIFGIFALLQSLEPWSYGTNWRRLHKSWLSYGVIVSVIFNLVAASMAFYFAGANGFSWKLRP